MAPIDRHERRQQRVRGAGPSSVQASFGFNFGLGAKVSKQSSLPPQQPARLPPTLKTPRSGTGSVQRYRSESIQRSSSAKPRRTPENSHQIPQLGKRKRGSTSAQPGADREELDELSPDRDENLSSTGKIRKSLRALSPNHEEVHGEPDELSILQEAPDELSRLEDSGTQLQKVFANSSMAVDRSHSSRAENKRIPPGNTVKMISPAHASEVVSVPARRSIARRSKSTDASLTTPETPIPTSLGAMLASPTTAPDNEESEDELSPLHAHKHIQHAEQQDSYGYTEGDNHVKGLSLPVQSRSPKAAQSVAQLSADEQDPTREGLEADTVSISLKKRRKSGRRQKLTEENGNEPVAASAAVNPPKRGRAKKATEVMKASQMTPISHNPVQLPSRSAQVEDEFNEGVELGSGGLEQHRDISPGAEDVPELSDAADSDEYEEAEPDEMPESTRQSPTMRHSPDEVPHTKPSKKTSSRKRQKFTGPTQAISVMRIKGSTVKGITVADTTRAILEETINHRLTRMTEKVQASHDSVRRKEMRSCINLTLSFKESLDEKLLDLQDANDVLSTGFKKLKLFKRDNAGLRKEILALQNRRQDIALEHDDVQAEFDAERAKVDAKNQLSANLYDIEAAVRKGREKARTEGKEDEGPMIPLSMMIDNVGRNVGSVGGGLLDHVKGFNDLLERAAGWLEGRA